MLIQALPLKSSGCAAFLVASLVKVLDRKALKTNGLFAKKS